MTEPIEDILIHQLTGAFRSGFRKLEQAVVEGRTADPAEWWARYVAQVDGCLLRELSAADRRQDLLPFDHPHRIGASLHSVMRGGLLGGPNINLHLQVRIRSEHATVAWGLPLVFHIVDGERPVPRATWDDIRDAARRLCDFTPVGRIVLIGHPAPFTPPGHPADVYWRSERTTVMPALLAAGMRKPPRGLSGMSAEHFASDMASGWVGDPALAGDAGDRVMEQFLRVFNVGTLLRITVDEQAHPAPHGTAKPTHMT